MSAKGSFPLGPSFLSVKGGQYHPPCLPSWVVFGVQGAQGYHSTLWFFVLFKLCTDVPGRDTKGYKGYKEPMGSLERRVEDKGL